METLFRVRLRFEHDVVIARQRAREVAEALGFGRQDQVRVATAVSELARLAFRGSEAGEIAFGVTPGNGHRRELFIEVRGAARGRLDDEGLSGPRRLLDRVEADREAGRVEARQALPGEGAPSPSVLEGIRRRILEQDPTNPFEELQQQNEDLVDALAALRERETERSRLLEAERRAREEAQRAVQDREEVLSVVSHDLRNPVGAILTGARFLLEHPELLGDLGSGDPDATGSRQLRAIVRSAERADRLIRDLLDVSSMEQGKLSVRRRPEAVAPILRDVEETHGSQAEERGLALEVDVAPDLPPVCADRSRLVQALSNLVGNAVKFTPSGGCVRMGAAPAEGAVVFTVADTGPGIAPADMEHLFDRFWQSTGHKAGGAGLGLAIVKGIVESHDGWIEVEAEPGQGTTFRFAIAAASEGCAAR